MVPVGRRALPGACAGPCCQPCVVRCVAVLRPAVSAIHPHAFRIGVHCPGPGRCLTRSHANTVLVRSGLLASLDVLSLVGMTLGAF